MPTTSTQCVRAACAADEPELLELFARVFGTQRSAERWQWQYSDSPGGPGFVSVAESGGRIVGCSAFMRRDLNYLGRRIPAGQSCDAMVLRESAGQGYFTAMFQRNRAAAEAVGWQAIFSFPNSKSFPIRVGRLGGQRVTVLTSYYRRLGAARVLGTVVDRLLRSAVLAIPRLRYRIEAVRIGRNAEVRVSREVPVEVEEMLREHRKQEVLSVWKDREYLNWRYARHPEHRYDVHVLYLDNQPRALSICRPASNTVSICELLHRRHDPRETALLLRHLVGYYGRSRAQILSFLGSDCGFFEAACLNADFTVRPFSRLSLVVNMAEASMFPEHSTSVNDWTVSFGDVDIA